MTDRKIQIGLAALALLGIVTGAILYRSLKKQENTVEKQASQLLESSGSFNAQTTETQVAELKEALLFLAKEVGTVKSASSKSNIDDSSSSFSRVSSPNLAGSLTSNSADLIIRIKSLEDKVLALEQKIGTTASPSPSTSTTVTKFPTQYIPLGIDSQTNDQNGVALDNYEINLDPAEFPGYTSMQLEVTLKLSEASGTLSSSLYNYTDRSEIQYSSVSTTSTNYLSLVSSTFKLPAGKKVYRIWAKSTNGFLGYIQSARLKVNY